MNNPLTLYDPSGYVWWNPFSWDWSRSKTGGTFWSPTYEEVLDSVAVDWSTIDGFVDWSPATPELDTSLFDVNFFEESEDAFSFSSDLLDLAFEEVEENSSEEESEDSEEGEDVAEEETTLTIHFTVTNIRYLVVDGRRVILYRDTTPEALDAIAAQQDVIRMLLQVPPGPSTSPVRLRGGRAGGNRASPDGASATTTDRTPEPAPDTVPANPAQAPQNATTPTRSSEVGSSDPRAFERRVQRNRDRERNRQAENRRQRQRRGR
jgi:hypothetical protein